MTYGCEVESGFLYRYRPYRADELRLLLAGGQLRFADANRFNDPWDCRPLLRNPFPDDPAENERWIGWLVGLRLKHGVIDPQGAEEYRAKVRANPALFHNETIDCGKRIIDEVRAKYRVLCLSTHGDIPLMWSHYADSHAGVCQIFDAHDEVIGQAQDMVYLPGYPAMDFPDPDCDVLTPAFLTKAEYWVYEREFRVIAKEGADSPSAFLACHQGYVQIKPTALVGLVLGCQMSVPHRAEAIAIARAAAHRVAIYVATLDEDSYGLRIVEQP